GKPAHFARRREEPGDLPPPPRRRPGAENVFPEVGRIATDGHFLLCHREPGLTGRGDPSSWIACMYEPVRTKCCPRRLPRMGHQLVGGSRLGHDRLGERRLAPPLALQEARSMSCWTGRRTDRPIGWLRLDPRDEAMGRCPVPGLTRTAERA